jgi:hypothetical protein
MRQRFRYFMFTAIIVALTVMPAVAKADIFWWIRK